MPTDHHAPPAWQVHGALLASAFLFGAGYVAAKLVVTQVPPAAWALVRVVGAGLLMAMLFGRHLKAAAPSWPTVRVLMVCALFGVVLNQLFFAFGMQRTTPSHGVLVNGMIPFFALVLAAMTGRERLSGAKLLGFLLAVSGLAYLLELDRTGWQAATWTGDLLNLCNSASYATYLVISRDVFQRHGWRVAMTAMFLLAIPAIGSVGAWPAWTFDWTTVPGWLWLIMALMIVGQTVMAYAANAWALEHAESSQVAAYVYVQPVVGIALAGWLMGDPITPRLLTSCLLIFAGLSLATVLPAWRQRRRPKRPDPAPRGAGSAEA